MNWFIKYNMLSLRQQGIIQEISRDRSGRHFITGFAGTGKTLILAHLCHGIQAANPSASMCFVSFTHALKDMVATEINTSESNLIDIKTSHNFIRSGKSYDFVFLDEVQDIPHDNLQKITKLCSNLIVAGDTEQQIYPDRATRDQILNTINPKTYELLEVFRLTKKLMRVAISVYPETRVVEGNEAYKNANASILSIKFKDKKSEADWIWKTAIERARPGDPSAILFPSQKNVNEFSKLVAENVGLASPPFEKNRYGKTDYNPFNVFWKDNEKPLMYLGGNYGSFPECSGRPLVYLMKAHSSKGIDFKNVFIPILNDEPWFGHFSDIDPKLERRLLFVAITRSRENLFLSYTSKKPHHLLSKLPSDAVDMLENPQTEVQDDDEDWF